MNRGVFHNTIPTQAPRDGLVFESLMDWNVLDTSWNWNHWTANNLSYTTAERWYVNQIWDFNGTSSYVEYTWYDADFIQKTGVFGVVFLLKLDSYNSNKRHDILWTAWWTSANTWFDIHYDNRSSQGSPKRLSFYIFSGSWAPTVSFSDDDVITDNDTHLVCVTWDWSDVKYYIDWVLYSTDVWVIWTANVSWEYDLTLWKTAGGTYSYTGWNIWLVRIYDSLLTQDDVTDLYLEGLR